MQHFKTTLTLQSLLLSTFLFFLLQPFNLLAEGTKSIAPSNADEAALFVGAGNTGTRGGDYGLFAWKDSDSKLYFNVQNSCEKVYMGFSIPKNDRSFSDVNPVYGGSGIEENLIFRVVDPLGNPINNLSCFGNTTINGEVWQTLNSTTANISSRVASDNGPSQLGNAAGYNGFELDLSACGLNLTGNYSIEFYTTNANYNPNTARSGFYIPYFDITVANCANQGVAGRVWSNNWGIGIKRDGSGSFDRAFNGSLFVCSSEGFITKIDFNTNTNTRATAGNSDQRSGFRAGSFNISFNRQGPGNSGDIITDRQSVPNVNSTNPLLPVFLNLPDEAFCPVQEIGEIKAAANFVTGCPQDRCINVAATQPGQFEIIIEGANGNGILDQPSERRVVYQITAADKVANPETAGFIYEACIPWDGKDGNGNMILEVAITVTGSYFQGIYHFPVYDAEFNDDGFIVETVRPALGRQLLYYDDTKITEASGSTESKDGTNGCTGPCHRWTGEWGNYFDKDDNYGNYNTINTWWFASTTAQDFTSNVGQLSPLAITCPIDFIGCTNQSTDPSVTGQATTVPDNLNCAFVLDYTDAVVTNNCTEKIIERTWFAYLQDLPNERKTCKQTITLKAPVLTNCPTDVVLNCADGNTYSWNQPTIAGLCGGTIQQTSGPVSGSVFPKGTTTITYEIVGGCGATQTCSFTVTVKDAGTLDDLTIICPTVPADATDDDCEGQSSDPSVTGTPTVVNNSSCPTTLEYTDAVTDNGCGAKTIKREWVVYFTNNPSIRKTCSQLIILTAPTLSNCPTDVVLDCGNGNTHSWNLPTVNGGCAGDVRQTSGLASGSTFPIGTTTITYEIGDGCANQTCSFTVTVKNAGDLNDLTIICPTVPADVADCSGQSSDPSVTGTPTVSNNSSCPTTLEYTDKVTDDGCGAKTIKREWVVYFTNNPSIRKTCSQLIILTAPMLSNCPTDVVLDCGNGNTHSWNLPTVNGGCAGDVRQTSGPVSGSIFPIGTTTITYEVGGGCANQTCSFTVTVKDAGNLDDLTIICPSVPADVADCSGLSTDPSVTGTPTISNNSSCPTTLEYTDKVTDDGCGAKTIKREWVVYFTNNPSIRKTCSQLIIITAPTLSNCPMDVVLDCGDGNTHSWNLPTVNGACAGTLRRTSGPASGSVFPTGTTTITYEVGEGCANQTCSFTVTVNGSGNANDLTITCPADVTGCAGLSTAPSTTGTATVTVANSNCPTTLIYNDVVTDNGCGAKTIQRAWSVYYTNKPTERKTCTQTITLTAPTLSNCPTDVVLGCEAGNTYSWTAPAANGACGGTIIQTSGPASGSSFPLGSTTITYQIGTGCANQTCSFTVTVVEGGGLTTNCPTDVVLDCEDGQNGAIYSWETPTASSCCNSCPEPGLDLTDFVYMGTLNGHQYYCSKEKADWATAKAMTESQGGHLAVINSAEENQMLSSFLNNQSAYIGLHDLQQEGVYQWLNNDPLTYTNWYPGQPNNYGNSQDYTRLLPNGQWDDIAGHYKLEYILEIPCLTIQQCAGPVSGSVFPVGITEVAYHIADNCGNEEVCTFNVTVNPCEALIDYCDVTGQNTSYFWIRHVVLGAINNPTVANGGYGDFTNLSTNIQAGSEQTIILSPGYARNKYYVNWRVWIDYNRDGDFNDANEEIFTYRDYNILKIKFRIPQQCAIGQTKMRVSMKYGNPANACSDFTYGEVEDYTINLTPATNGLSAIATTTSRSTNDVEVEVIPHESTAPLKNLLPTEMPSLTVFPNPVATNLQVQLSDAPQLKGALKIYNHLGQIVHQELLSKDIDQQLSIDVNHLPDGMYLLSIESDDMEPIVQKFNKH